MNLIYLFYTLLDMFLVALMFNATFNRDAHQVTFFLMVFIFTLWAQSLIVGIETRREMVKGWMERWTKGGREDG